ncbi:MAG: peptidoglycan DD-metalloendopeptidase family protein [Acidimicrobiia bacterium]|nr:peptidoglycan DD-metalloendopeptidase family protein [Acidimicrobiia bacterium]
MTVWMVAGVAGPVLAQDAPEESPLPAPANDDPLINEGASDELDPNTPAEPGDGLADDAGAEPEEECDLSDSAVDSPDADGEAEECTPKPRGRYANQPEFKPDVLNRSEVRRVTRTLEQARVGHAVNVSRVRGFRLHEKRLAIEREALSAETIEALDKLAAIEEQLRRRALATFVKGDSFELAPSLEHDDILRHQQQQFLVAEVLSIDQDLLEEYTRLRNRLEAEALELYDRQAMAWQWLREAVASAEESSELVEDLEFELATWNNLSATFIDSVVWPIDGDYEQTLINSWGYPRAPGTIDEHWHEGIDIFAPEGERLVAAEGGEVTDIGVGTLGGLKIWILGDSGTRWYYAHLMAFSPDLQVGDRVKAGDLIGFVGKTGNAISTPPHLHLQVHPGGGRPVNPYPILKAASDRYQKGIGRQEFDIAVVVGFDGTRLLPNGSTIGQVQNRALEQDERVDTGPQQRPQTSPDRAANLWLASRPTIPFGSQELSRQRAVRADWTREPLNWTTTRAVSTVF